MTESDARTDINAKLTETPALRQLTSERFEQHCLRQLDALDVLADSNERREPPEEDL